MVSSFRGFTKSESKERLKNTVTRAGCQANIFLGKGNPVADLWLKRCKEGNKLKNKISGSTHRTIGEALLSQTLASTDKNEFRITSAAAPYVAGGRSSGRSGGRFGS
jgi:hypothetical protein